jgi:hypothetical protein
MPKQSHVLPYFVARSCAENPFARIAPRVITPNQQHARDIMKFAALITFIATPAFSQVASQADYAQCIVALNEANKVYEAFYQITETGNVVISRNARFVGPEQQVKTSDAGRALSAQAMAYTLELGAACEAIRANVK